MSDQVPDPNLQPETAIESPDSTGLNVADRYDAGETGCGELIVKLNGRVKKLQPHQVLHLISLDSGAIEDIPAWCQLTGHRLLRADHPDYWIVRRAD
jgi:tRNA 2-thiouridine synthesizing protein A